MRESKAHKGELTLTVFVDGHVRHIRVRQIAGRGIALRADPTDREVFRDMKHLVDTYTRVKLQLRGSIPFYLVPHFQNNNSEA